MAVSIFARSYFRRLAGIVNNVTVLISDTSQYSNTKLRTYTSSDNNNDKSIQEEPKKMSKVMLAYLQRAKEHDKFIKNEIAQYELGKRHLANMMGEDPEFFTQKDINKSIEYLFPSGIFDPKARPIMQHPNEIFPSRKAAEFDETGRPFHSMFYTSKPNYYQILYDIMEQIIVLNDIEDSYITQEGVQPVDKINLLDSMWLSKDEIEKVLLENIKDLEYNYLITSLDRLCKHPLSKRAENLINKYRKVLTTHINKMIMSPLEYDSSGRPYITVKQCAYKSTRGEVTVRGNGSGKITINGQDITYFEHIRHREQCNFAGINSSHLLERKE